MENQTQLYSPKSSTVTLMQELQAYSVDHWTLANNDRSVGLHRLFMYPAMMVAEVQQELIKIIKIHKKQVNYLIDPFMGGGTSLVAGIYNGINCYGQDINPLSLLLSKVKTSLLDIDTIQLYSSRIKESIKAKRVINAVQFNNIDKWFTASAQEALNILREAILTQVDNVLYRRFFWIILSEVIRLGSNDRTSTYKLHIRTPEDIQNRQLDLIKSFFEKVAIAKFDYRTHYQRLIFSKVDSLEVRISLGDSSKEIIAPSAKCDLLVTSPPYGDNQTTVTYGQHSYLPLKWIPFGDIENGLTEEQYVDKIQTIDSMSLGGLKKGNVSELQESLFSKSVTLEKYYTQISDKKRSKVFSFFFDLDTTLQNISKIMNPGAFQLWTIGNRNVDGIEIPNNIILREMLSFYNVHCVEELSRNIERKRMPDRNKSSKTMRQEKIIVAING